MYATNTYLKNTIIFIFTATFEEAEDNLKRMATNPPVKVICQDKQSIFNESTAQHLNSPSGASVLNQTHSYSLPVVSIKQNNAIGNSNNCGSRTTLSTVQQALNSVSVIKQTFQREDVKENHSTSSETDLQKIIFSNNNSHNCVANHETVESTKSLIVQIQKVVNDTMSGTLFKFVVT